MTTAEAEGTRLELARGYLAEYLADEEIRGHEAKLWFEQLGKYVEQLPLNDELISKAAIYLQPFPRRGLASRVCNGTGTAKVMEI